MLFSLEALEAKHGDCLLLYCGTTKDPQILLIDGGPSGVYRKSLRPRLDELRSHFGADKALPIKLAVVSHIDDDHIRGILDLAKAVDETEGNEIYDVKELWHNSFDDIVGGPVQSNAKIAAAASSFAVLPVKATASESRAVVASVPQGRMLRDLARKLDWDLNHTSAQAKESLVMVKRGAPCLMVENLAPGLKVRILAPRQDEIDALQKEWDEQLIAKDLAEALAFSDRSVFNLSSIVMLAECNERRMLLTGDARGDLILQGLDAAKLPDDDGRFRCDLFKVPHHGSHRNVTEEMFRRVPAEHYVISADGRHDNPDVRMLEMLTSARGAEEYTLWFTNRVDAAANFLDQDSAKPGRNYRFFYADKEQGSSLQIHLGSATPAFCK